MIFSKLKNIQVYNQDGRPPVSELYEQYEELVIKYKWKRENIYIITTETPHGRVEIPALAYFSSPQGPAFWVNAGIHGEESSGPIALGRSVGHVGKLGQKIPMVVIPLLNPVGYSKGWRYFNKYRNSHQGLSVGDSEHYLPGLDNPNKPRASAPSSEVAAAVTKFALDHMINYPPVLTIDHHEDESLPQAYVYSQGAKGAKDPAAKYVVGILAQILPVQMKGTTRFGEKVKEGIVIDQFGKPVKDGSIDEFYAAPRIFVGGNWVNKPASRTSLVIETPMIGIPLEKRILAHTVVIHHYQHLWQLAQSQ